MSILNSKYTTHMEIVNRLSRVIKTKEINPSDIMEWCQVVETEIIMDESIFYDVRQHELTVTTIGQLYQVALPLNVYKLYDVYSNKYDRESRLEFQNTGTYLIFKKKPSKVFIDYLGMPFQEEAPYYPLILKGHELACEAYCKKTMYEEDYLLGKIDGQRWQALVVNSNNQIMAAMVDNERHKTKDDQDKIQIIRSNMLLNFDRRELASNEYGTA